MERLNLPAKKLEQLNKKGLTSVQEVLDFLPRKYMDFSASTPITYANIDSKVMVHAYLKSIKEGNGVINAYFVDVTTKENFQVTWFRSPYIKASLVVGQKYTIAGKVSLNEYLNIKNFTNPDVFEPGFVNKGIMPVYSVIKGMSLDYLYGIVNKCLKYDTRTEFLTEFERQYANLISSENVYNSVHQPKDMNDVKAGNRRIVFDKIYTYLKGLEELKKSLKNDDGKIFNDTSLCDTYIKSLPYELTSDQQKTITELLDKAKTGATINALVRGDVGCGKTSVAVALACGAISSGYQAVIMAPTTIVAVQHYEGLFDFAINNDINIALFTSKNIQINGVPVSRAKMLKIIEENAVDIIVSTQSVLSDSVHVNNLGLVIVDEEHKFGVSQKEKLAGIGVHKIIMTATPIPRSLAMGLYGELMDVYSIETMPNGRKPVKTEIIKDNKEVFERIREEINKGQLAYVVCPAIDTDNENMDSVEDVFKEVSAYFKGTDIKPVMLHGKMKAEEINQITQDFKAHKYHILVSTTVVEVGVNVPDATIINIRSFNRMGMSTLHQLRGRVGRNSLQSYCILSTNDNEYNGKDILCRSNDGLVVSEKDMEMRGTGELLGEKQSGEDEAMTLILTYPEIFEKANAIVKRKVG